MEYNNEKIVLGGGNFPANDGRKSIKEVSKAKERYNALDGIRALACIGIVLMHVLSNTCIKPDEGWWLEIIRYCTNFVFLFMMVSAFSLSCGYYERFKNRQISVDSFYKKRYQRILPFFILLVLIDWAFSRDLKSVFEGLAQMTMATNLLPDPDLSVIGVSWFLSIIFIFYMVYPFFVFLMGNKTRGWIATGVGVYLYMLITGNIIEEPFGIATIGRTNFLFCTPYLLTGGLIYLYRTDIKSFFSSKVARLILLFVLVAYSVLFFMTPNMPLIKELVWYVLILMYAISESNTTRKWTLLDNRIMKFVSGSSMEIYLCHMMCFRFVEKSHIQNWIDNNNLNYIITSCCTLLVAIAFAWSWKKWVEPKVLTLFDNKNQK